MTREQYNAIDALNFSKSKHLLRSIAHFKHEATQPREESEAMMVGTSVHLRVLENKVPTYAIRTADIDYRTNAGKAWRDKQTSPIITEEAAARALVMSEAIKADPTAKAILDGCPQREVAFQAEFKGVRIKGLLDALGVDKSGAACIADIKCVQDNSPEAFAKMVVNYNYACQSEWYQAVWAKATGSEERASFVWITVASTEPHIVQCYYADEDVIKLGTREMDTIIDRYKTIGTEQEIKGYGGGMAKISLPRWATRD